MSSLPGQFWVIPTILPLLLTDCPFHLENEQLDIKWFEESTPLFLLPSVASRMPGSPKWWWWF